MQSRPLAIAHQPQYRERNREAHGFDEVCKISTDDSKVTVLVVPTDEERMMAREALRALSRSYITGVLKEQKQQPFLVEVSAHHIHLTQEHVEALFGKGHQLTKHADLSQPGQFACKEQLTIVGPKGRIERVRVLGPTRKYTQIEIAMTEQFKLGVQPPVRESGDIADTPGCTLESPTGSVKVDRGVICALRHVHMTPEDALPATAQLVWANMMLHAVVDPPALFERWQQLLRVDGFVMFSCLGPGTLRELRALYAQLGWPPATPGFVDMHDLGDMLVQAGFADPVMDQETLTLQYDTPQALLDELRTLGGNTAPDRFAGLRTPRWRARLLRELEALRGRGGKLELSFEVAYGHAFRAAPRLRPGEATSISLDDMRAMVRSGRSSPHDSRGGEAKAVR